MTKQQLLDLVEEIEHELGKTDLKNKDLIHSIGTKLQDCRNKLILYHDGIIDDVDEFLELLEQCDIDGIIEVDEMLGIVDQLHDIIDGIKGQVILEHNISKDILLQTKSLLESVKN